MRTFTLQQSRTEVYTPNGGLALVGHCLNRHTSLTKTARTVAKRHGIPNIELIRTYLGLITLGKSDFEAVEPVRTDPFFKSALGIKQSPSSARLRQRFDEDAQGLTPLLDDASVEFLQSVEAPVSPLAMGHVALDMDVFPMDNSQTHKEGVSYTYKGYDGYAPLAAYLGQEGWCLGCELRHAQRLVYSEGLNLSGENATPIGAGCRVCERDDCPQRAFPALGRALDIDDEADAGLEAGRAEVRSLQRKNERLKELVGAWNAATLEERHQLLTMMLDAVYVDMTQGLVLGLKPKPEFLPLFNLGEPVTTGDSELVTGGMEQS